MAWAADPVTAAWTVSVNVSASQFAQDDFERNVAKALQGTGANPRRLKLELTESMLAVNMDDIVPAAAVIGGGGRPGAAIGPRPANAATTAAAPTSSVTTFRF